MNILTQIIDVQEAAELWGLSPDHVKRLCRTGEVEAKKIGNSWAVVKNQKNPKQRGRKTTEEKEVNKMEVTIDLTEGMIAKLEAYRASNFKAIEGLLIKHTDKDSKDFLEGQIAKYQGMPMKSLLENYLS